MRAEIPVDLLNPGQVFACHGLAELAQALTGQAHCAFDWSDPETVCFALEGAGDVDPVEACLSFLLEAEVEGEAPPRSASQLGDADDDAETLVGKWGVSLRRQDGQEVYSIPQPRSLATWPALMTRGDHQIRIDHWGDGTGRDKVKFWAGSGGIPGARLLSDALQIVAEVVADPAARTEATRDPFALAAAQSSSFRFDWRRDYVPLDAGFSPNAHGAITSVGFPLVEVLAAIGLSHARPLRPDRRDKLLYRYAVVGSPGGGLLPLPVVRAALGSTGATPFPTRRFRMHLNWPGQEGQARCITHAIEEI